MISTIILTHNDKQSLSKTLESVSWCDETIVVDDYSSDDSVKIAEKFKARIYQRQLKDDFAGQRNYGLAQAKGEWVLFVDSDEVVSAALADEIRHATKNTKQVGYFLKRKDWFLGRWLGHGETSRVQLLRLAKKDGGHWRRPVHEVWEIQGSVGTLLEPLLHYPHPNVAQFLEEINYYSTLNAKYLHEKKVWVSWWQIVAYPSLKFFLNYIWYLGFLDGTAGAVVAILMSFHSFLTRAKLWQLYHQA